MIMTSLVIPVSGKLWALPFVSPRCVAGQHGGIEAVEMDAGYIAYLR
ncbi:hypothetical protein [Mycobacterium xenopi]|uniref:Uncharacterized protein n=1 Tax=Mycobacterium xenopi 4042 TaxID=1299334 RepID=X7ZXN1_MYCXE|nr:hypothetical protein [Mycobacterium xenopi]EUA23493.1 hypothetical protein I553_5395 [Mycobacterium xenopi 4042]MDA3639097.1 hypothetical protein [Mycobacterium xenopi]MDA3657469.1 hypothetical protein [Mycobacterium xenopi]MDA3661361.1 hypothetical protein [Mycobacterium xenopi]